MPSENKVDILKENSEQVTNKIEKYKRARGKYK